MTPTMAGSSAHDRLVRRSRWRVALLGALVVAAVLAVLSAGAYLLARHSFYVALQDRLEDAARRAQLLPGNGGTLVVDERGRPLAALPADSSPDHDRAGLFSLTHDPRWGNLAVLRLSAGGPWEAVATPAQAQIDALADFLRLLAGLTIVSALAALPVGFVLAGRALSPLEAAVRERNEFVALASHQLRTPLSIIRTSAELARGSRALTPDEALARIVGQAERMEQLAGRLSALARAGTRDGTAPQGTDVVATARDVLHGLGPAAEAAGVELHLDSGGPVAARVDAAELTDALTAVLENAIRHSPRDGRVSVSVAADGRWARIAVADQGEGIAAEDLPHVTEPFFQGRGARGGHGLGLAIVRAVAERHGGRLDIRSAPENGTTVELTLPAGAAKEQGGGGSDGTSPSPAPPGGPDRVQVQVPLGTPGRRAGRDAGPSGRPIPRA